MLPFQIFYAEVCEGLVGARSFESAPPGATLLSCAFLIWWLTLSWRWPSEKVKVASDPSTRIFKVEVLTKGVAHALCRSLGAVQLSPVHSINSKSYRNRNRVSLSYRFRKPP